jgi:CRP-like cAMP-binding protein
MLPVRACIFSVLPDTPNKHSAFHRQSPFRPSLRGRSSLTQIKNQQWRRRDPLPMSGPAITAVPTAQQNSLLAALSVDARQRIFPHLELVSLPLGETLSEPGDSQRHIYFPIDSIVSLLYALESGASAEISVVGNEGLIGVASFMGGESTPNRAVVVSAGAAWRLQAHWLRDEFNRCDETMRLLLRYAQSLMTQVAQTAVCNRRHTVDQQLCRWFLFALDRMSGSKLTMTQELIAHTLGVRRESVTEAACKLQKVGAIAYCHGHITVLDRSTLEQLSCECYAVVKKETDRLMPSPDRVGHDASAHVDLIGRFRQARPRPLDAAALPIRNRARCATLRPATRAGGNGSN